MRILGDEINLVRNLISPIRYSVAGFENIAELEERDMKLWLTPGDFVQKQMPARLTKQYVKNQILRFLSMPNPTYINWDYYRTVYVDYLRSKIDLANARFLVVPQQVPSVILANQLHRLCKVPYASWMMDDHLLRYDHETGSYGYPYPENYEKEFGYHLRNAKHVFTISPELSAFYKKRFGVDSTVLFSPADPVVKPINSAKGRENSLRFCHFGRIWKWPVDAVEKFATHLESLNGTLDIYSHFPLEGCLKENPRVFEKEPIAPGEVSSRMQEYDAVTIFYGMEDSVRPLSAFNISTKMSECLASGLPVVFVGPEYGAMTQWARKHGCGLILSEIDNDNQVRNIRNLNDSDFATSVALRCLSAAREFTSHQAMRKIWEHGWTKVLNNEN